MPTSDLFVHAIGRVWQAVDRHLERPVAVKVLLEAGTASPCLIPRESTDR